MVLYGSENVIKMFHPNIIRILFFAQFTFCNGNENRMVKLNREIFVIRKIFFHNINVINLILN